MSATITRCKICGKTFKVPKYDYRVPAENEDPEACAECNTEASEIINDDKS